MVTTGQKQIIPSSFRDPSGFIFSYENVLYRQINTCYQKEYDHLMNSGLYQTLVDKGLLIPHKEVDGNIAFREQVYKVIQPEIVDYISYPYEWSFSQLKDAALLTLEIQKIALEYGMTLKDATAYNVQFYKGKPVFIDTLSFDLYNEGDAWVAYRQFCQHFLSPLALMHYTDIDCNKLLRIYLDGIRLDLVSKLLPWSTKLRFSLLLHIHLHAKSQKFYSDKGLKKSTKTRTMSKFALSGLIDSLTTITKKLKWKEYDTEWGNYYQETNYVDDAMVHKKELLNEFVNEINPKKVWDLGANTGVFSRIASEKNIPTVSFDIDPVAVENNYQQVKKNNETSILPLILDLTNPSPSIGWANEERTSFMKRAKADTIFALALIHHLVISNNLPFTMVAQFFAKIGKYLIIEFVPKEDSQVQKLLSSREDIFPTYTQKDFEECFGEFFIIRKSVSIRDSKRTLYLMEKKRKIS